MLVKSESILCRLFIDLVFHDWVFPFQLSPSGRIIFWFTGKQTVTKVNPLVNSVECFWWQLPIGSGLWRTYFSPPSLTHYNVLKFFDSQSFELLRAWWHWHFCLGLVVESPFEFNHWDMIQRWQLTGPRSFHKDVIRRSEFHYWVCWNDEAFESQVLFRVVELCLGLRPRV